MEITIIYQGRQVTLTKPETKYGSNLDAFVELVSLAFEGVGLYFDGQIGEIAEQTTPQKSNVV